MTYLYIIENLLNNKIYVGVSSSPARRFREHKTAAKNGKKSYYLHHAMKKYLDNIDQVFKMTIIQYFDSYDEAFLQEKYWISCLKKYGIVVYNETEGGEGIYGENNYFYGKSFSGAQHPLYGTKRPQNVLDALSKAHKGKVITESSRKKMSDSHKGKHAGDKNHMFGKIGELNPNGGISDNEAIVIHKLYHINNLLIKDIVKLTGVNKSTIDRVVYCRERFIWLKEFKH